MKRKILFIIMAVMITLGLSSCKKDSLEFWKNDSFVECYVNGEFAKDKGLRQLFSAPSDFHMNYFYNGKDTFTFNIAKTLLAKDGTSYAINLSFAQKSLPVVGEKYSFEKHIDNDNGYKFADKLYLVSVGVKPYLYECADTSFLPKDIRKKKIM